LKNKIAIYLFPGLGANYKIFENLTLPNTYEIIYLEWKVPTSIDQPILDYAKLYLKDIKHEKPVLVGVSFGGIMVQEISKLIPTLKTIIISSIKNHLELPSHLQMIKNSKVYRLFPYKIVENIEDFLPYFLGDFANKKAELYKMYLSVRNPIYLKWAIYTVLHWQQEKQDKNIVHIHGTKDGVFPTKYINDYISIEGGTHVMILFKARKISEFITNIIEHG